jgi:hypothetical protein
MVNDHSQINCEVMPGYRGHLASGSITGSLVGIICIVSRSWTPSRLDAYVVGHVAGGAPIFFIPGPLLGIRNITIF